MTAKASLHLQARNLELCFQGQTVWQIPELQWLQGQCVWLRGQNGSGKTSLMKILGGLQKPSKGQVELSSSSIRPLQACCYLHQQPYMFNTSVKRNLELAAQGKKLEAQAGKEAVLAALRWSRLDAQAEQPARTLSGGERQRLALARAKLVQPHFWLLDEPTANLDSEAVQILAQLVSDLKRQGSALLITSHQANPVTELCNSHWLLNNGGLEDEHQETT
ncbi:ABC transporter ATP-binding protein [Marinospirillum sp.]|uniref:ABC transporter ATP-binding protein n=1 Tax=Marinospirillum sp. TaxID=2183934 RepID=UPI00286FAF62|nr:ABC transporter ATP-binding protein [Marinospirillum sp.]MDR9468698.1 ABC transporter ATP-binding protein [Marinospirillum sp.]